MQTADRSYQWITLQTEAGRAIVGRMVLGTPVESADSGGDLFDLVEQPDGTVVLFSLATQGFVAVHDGLVGAFAQSPGDAATFKRIEVEGGLSAFQLADGLHYLSAPVGNGQQLNVRAAQIGAAERFRLKLFDFRQLPLGRSGCCHAWTRPDDSPGVLWDDQTHEEILKWAMIGMRRPEIQTEDTKRMIAFWSRSEFELAAYKGLEDADYEDPWRGSVILLDRQNRRNSVFTWHDHFYNPTNGKNYMGMETSAVTEGRRLFNLAVHGGMRLLKMGGWHAPVSVHQRTGHQLGLSLHFLTDLTQPMHAANFTNVYGKDGGYPIPILWDRRHSQFETRAETMVNEGYLNNYDTRFPIRPQDVETGDVVDAEWFLYHTAVNQHRVFLNPLEAKIDQFGASSDPWTEADSKPTLDQSLLHAPRTVARYLSYWSRCANQTWDQIDPNYYYRILTPGHGWVCIHNRHFKRDTFNDGRGLMFFIFNADGTWSIGCKDYKANLWLGYDGTGGHWIGENRTNVTTPPESSRFRFVPAGATGQTDEFFIYENTRDEAVTVNEKGLWFQVDFLIRWPGTLPKLQKFRLQRMHEIPVGEREEIRNRWPDYLAHPWYGRH